MKKSKNILIVTYFSYQDALTQTFTLPYIRIIRKILPSESTIHFVTLEQPRFVMSKEEEAKIKNDLNKEGLQWIAFQYKGSGIKALLGWVQNLSFLSFLCIRKKITFIHGWCQTAGALAYLLSIITRRTLVIDSYEPHAESMVENNTWKRESLLFKMLFLLEKRQSLHASKIIAATKGMRGYAKEKYKADFNQYWVKPACVNLNLFSKDQIKNPILLKENNLDNKIVCVYAGKFGGIYLDVEVFEFFKIASEFWKDKFRVILLTSHPKEEIISYCQQVGLDYSIFIQKFVPHAEVPSYMGLADFAISPVKPVPSKRYCTPIKNGEYWAMGLPVVIPQNISDDSEIIEQENIGAVLKSLSKEEYMKAILKIDELLKTDKKELYTRITSVAKKYRSFEIAERVYSEVYSTE